MRVRGRCVVVATIGIALAQLACPPAPCACEPPSGGGPQLQLRPGVAILDSVPLNLSGQVPIGISDVDQAGAEIAVLEVQGCYPVVYLSKDVGMTWEVHRLPYEPGCGVTNTSEMLIHLSAVPGHAAMVVLTSDASGNSYYQFRDVNLSTNTYTVVPGGIRWGYLFFRGDQVVSYDNEVASNGITAYRFFTYTLSTRTITFTGNQYTASGATCQGYPWASQDGQTFNAFCYLAAANAWCELSVTTTTSYVPTTACVPTSQWPPLVEYPSPSLVHRQYYIRSGVYAEVFPSYGHVYTNGHVYLASLSSLAPPAVAPPIDLGVGSPYDPVASSNHQRYGWMAPVKGNPDKLVRVPPSGPPLSVPVPTSACVGLSSCAGIGGFSAWPYGDVTWLLPLGNDDYLVFYAFHRANTVGSDPDMICVSREHAPGNPL